MKREKTELPHIEPKGISRMRLALEDLGECWMYGPEFRATYGISVSTMTRCTREFSEYCFIFQTTAVWSGSTETIKTLKEGLGV